MGRAYSMNGREEYRVYIIGGKPEGKRPLERQDVVGWIILR
jgi:hypothetical protein